MADQPEEGSRRDIEAMLIDRANSDPEFRAALITDPIRAVEQEIGGALPTGVSIQILEEQPGEVVLVLPPLQPTSGAVSDGELATTAGGGWNGDVTLGYTTEKPCCFAAQTTPVYC